MTFTDMICDFLDEDVTHEWIDEDKVKGERKGWI
jgi:hypothetical protein